MKIRASSDFSFEESLIQSLEQLDMEKDAAKKDDRPKSFIEIVLNYQVQMFEQVLSTVREKHLLQTVLVLHQLQ